jgi:hypothetical protein
MRRLQECAADAVAGFRASPARQQTILPPHLEAFIANVVSVRLDAPFAHAITGFDELLDEIDGIAVIDFAKLVVRGHGDTSMS